MSVGPKPRVLLVRGHQANSWHLRQWDHLDGYHVESLQTGSNWFDTGHLEIEQRSVRTMRDLLPKGRIGDLAVRLPGDRYLNPAKAFAGADIVHSQDLGFWYSMQAARNKAKLGYKLVLTVWETIPFVDAYRNVRTRPYRKLVLRETDLFLAATERARDCLLLEGASAERIQVAPPGVDQDLFTRQDASPSEHVIVSPGRLVWEKGHQDLIRALAAIRRGVVDAPAVPRAIVIGTGPEEQRLRAHATDLGVADLVEFRANVPYREMGGVYSQASCMVLGSIPIWSWEEQFGMVIPEAMSAGLPVIAASSGAIPEVLQGEGALFPPGDWLGLARQLASGPLARPPGTRVDYDPELVERYSSTAAAKRLDAAYAELLSP
jgi:glycosyltransferase involved in cell wall biosynthesis